jgi:2,3-bisphosphoglycerate-independent phosphoglycerate mutase
LNGIVLIVMDGWGISPKKKGNCIRMARTPFYEFMKKEYSFTQLKASGNAVGLPGGSQGNSEVGHLHMGAGRIVWQPFEKINRAVKTKEFEKNAVLQKAISHAKKNNTALHLLGLCSDAGVHSSTVHLEALLKMAKKHGQKKVFVHFIADGRDVPEKSAKKYASKIIKAGGNIVSVCGRYYAMDRDKNWSRTRRAYELLTQGKGHTAKNVFEAIKKAYERGEKTDYYMEPARITDKNNSSGLIKDRDSVIFFNFRTDRPRQLTESFVKKKFLGFKRNIFPKNILFTTMTQYDKKMSCPFAFSEEKIKNNLGEVLSKKKLKQVRIAETEKYAHVTYFFNSQREKPYPKEERFMIPSLKIASYDARPQMSANEIAEKTRKRIAEKKASFILVNFANCDLVGHSANIPAIIKAVETVDSCTKKVTETALANNYAVMITADHGSAEEKVYANGKPKPSHSTNPVPFFLAFPDKQKPALAKGELSQIAPTALDVLKIKKPKEMNAETLIKKTGNMNQKYF